jgi:hypothetical protein
VDVDAAAAACDEEDRRRDDEEEHEDHHRGHRAGAAPRPAASARGGVREPLRGRHLRRCVRRGQGLGLIRSEHGGEGPAVAGGRALSRLACGSGEWRGDATDGKRGMYNCVTQVVRW